MVIIIWFVSTNRWMSLKFINPVHNEACHETSTWPCFRQKSIALNLMTQRAIFISKIQLNYLKFLLFIIYFILKSYTMFWKCFVQRCRIVGSFYRYFNKMPIFIYIIWRPYLTWTISWRGTDPVKCSPTQARF